MKTVLKVMLGIGLACVVPATASASRPASAAEAAEIAALFSMTPECSTVVVSSANTRYARSDYATPYPDSCTQDRGNGFGIARLDGAGRWRDAYQASESSEVCPAVGIPTKAGVELDACSRPNKHTYLATFRGLQDRPRRLDYGTRNQLLGLRWRRWGKSAATATGTFFYNDANPGVAFRVPVRVTVSKRTYCGAKRTYLRFKVSALKRRDRGKIAGFATGPQTYNCAGKQVLDS